MKYNKIFGLMLLAGAGMFISGCDNDDPDTCKSVITTPNTEQTDLDKWLMANFNIPYNIDFKYRYEDIEGNFDYYLVPARYEDAVVMAHLIKHMCVDAYNEVAGTDFTCHYFPKMFYTTGEWEYNNNGTYILGTAEGGRKIFLAGLNYLSQHLGNKERLNYYYFKTIHHEFTHIMNQTRTIPVAYQTITPSDYVADMWNESPYKDEYLDKGFVSPYSRNAYTEDFAEVLARYVTNTPEGWEALVGGASEEGLSAINQKLEIVREYLFDNFNIDLDQLRDVVQRREDEVVSGEIDLTDLTVY